MSMPTMAVFGWGLLTWLVPFVVSLLCYAPDEAGEMALVMDKIAFKTLMMIIGSLVGHIALHRTIPSSIKRSEKNPLAVAFLHGMAILSINWLLDILILLPLAQLTLGQWFVEIGARYIPILFTAILLGANVPSEAVERRKEE